jgi:hypothetical protein
VARLSDPPEARLLADANAAVLNSASTAWSSWWPEEHPAVASPRGLHALLLLSRTVPPAAGWYKASLSQPRGFGARQVLAEFGTVLPPEVEPGRRQHRRLPLSRPAPAPARQRARRGRARGTGDPRPMIAYRLAPDHGVRAGCLLAAFLPPVSSSPAILLLYWLFADRPSSNQDMRIVYMGGFLRCCSPASSGALQRLRCRVGKTFGQLALGARDPPASGGYSGRASSGLADGSWANSIPPTRTDDSSPRPTRFSPRPMTAVQTGPRSAACR